MKECQNIEFKETWSDDYLKWICGFANAQGGKLYIGVDDSENIVGVKNARKLLEDMFHKVVPFHKTILRFIKVMTEMLYPCTHCAFNYLMIQKHRRVK